MAPNIVDNWCSCKRDASTQRGWLGVRVGVLEECLFSVIQEESRDSRRKKSCEAVHVRMPSVTSGAFVVCRRMHTAVGESEGLARRIIRNRYSHISQRMRAGRVRACCSSRRAFVRRMGWQTPGGQRARREVSLWAQAGFQLCKLSVAVS